MTAVTQPDAGGEMVAHVIAAQPQLLPTRAAAGGHAPQPQLDRPKIDISCSPAKWADFCLRWRRFQNGSSIPAAQAPAQLPQCLEDELFSTATRAIGPKIDALDIKELLLELKQVAVILVAIGMRRSEALSAKQAAGEWFQQFTHACEAW